MENNKAHVVCIPSPAQGHINAMLQLAKLLCSRSIPVTFVHPSSISSCILATAGPASLDGLPDFRFETIPDGLELEVERPPNGKELSALCLHGRKKFGAEFGKLLKRLNVSEGRPKVTCIFCDTFSSYALDVAAELAIPAVSFCSVSACGFWGFFLFKELIERGLIPLKSENDLHNGYLDTYTDWITGQSMRLKDFPSFIRTADHNDALNFCKDECQDALKATALIINTFDDLEAPVLDAISNTFPSVHAVGPLNLMCRRIQDEALKNIGSSMWKKDSGCLKWLEGRLRGSVIYVNFGSLAVMSSNQLNEFAWGLTNSGYHFLWVIRPDMVTENSVVKSEEFLSVVCERGLVSSWCPQEEVLMHPSIGAFLTHCGWNSTMESISEGVPMICWPYFGDQPTNCRYVCNEWEIGLEIDNDVRREDVEKSIRKMMESEKGAEMRKTALRWKERAIKATQPNGKSFLDLERVINEIILQKKGFM